MNNEEILEDIKRTDAMISVIENYYRASNALMNIGTMEGISEELRDICAKASNATYKIIGYVNDNKDKV